ncbi:GLPGLI family protein [Chitinophaga sp. Mgbs1]|uniref:GLPGLI family protein n=1 Tax=Chitinophaga solisilvae TaxID=1233460 RepID=A0A9Q5D7H9_9BACT|nr:GLPGLI family protein [Chitinophaga solisilvae]
MNQLSRIILTAAVVLPFSGPLLAQQSGTITYEVTAKTDPERMRGFRGGDDNNDREIPETITFTQLFTFSNGNGKLTTERPDFGNRRPQRDSAIQGQRRMGFRNNAQYTDLTHKKYLQVFSTSGDDKKTYYAEEDYVVTADPKAGDKTRKIAGYPCKKATIKLHDDSYTVWYTTALPFSYSPVNGLLPDSNGVVLSAEGSKRAFIATEISLKSITDNDLTIPANAEKISLEQLRDIRKQEMEKFRKRQP